MPVSGCHIYSQFYLKSHKSHRLLLCIVLFIMLLLLLYFCPCIWHYNAATLIINPKYEVVLHGFEKDH